MLNLLSIFLGSWVVCGLIYWALWCNRKTDPYRLQENLDRLNRHTAIVLFGSLGITWLIILFPLLGLNK